MKDYERNFNILRGVVMASYLDHKDKLELNLFIDEIENETEAEE